MIKNSIIIKGARENNLKNISLTLPKNKLIVFTGVSGSGKSSLAFNTIYEEGRRRYVDSLSSYARQFLGGTNKPLVDSIEGLSPSISIEQKTTHNNPRSTVGTVTEIYDYLRLLYARIGLIYCPNNHGLITSQSIENIVKEIYKFKTNTKLNILSPIVNNEKGTFYNLFTKLKAENWIRVRVNGVIYKLEDNIELDKNKKHNIEILIDRLILTDDNRSRLVQAIEIALNESNGLVLINNLDNKTETTYSQHHSCSVCYFNMPLIEPRIFSFNSPNGMCTSCKGLGFKNEVDPKKLMPNMDKSINQGGIKYFENLINTRNIEW
ncbi:MAG: excinuclease ABC subunit UvrA, partial [Mycoplasma sp.]|nr:excinuclease ABC subunit UvrA [Mycoplasma sp.]